MHLLSRGTDCILFPALISGCLYRAKRRAWQPTPVFFAGEPHGQRSLVGYSLGTAKSLRNWAYIEKSLERWWQSFPPELRTRMLIARLKIFRFSKRSIIWPTGQETGRWGYWCRSADTLAASSELSNKLFIFDPGISLFFYQYPWNYEKANSANYNYNSANLRTMKFWDFTQNFIVLKVPRSRILPGSKE